MRLGASCGTHYPNVEAWISDLRAFDAGTSSCPLSVGAEAAAIAEYRKAAEEYNVTIGEVGVWRNTLSPDEAKRKEAVLYATQCLALADALGAGCCVNIAGAAGQVWDAYYEANYAPDSYALIVDTVREIIDSVKPQHTFYTLEPMPWMHPDSPEDYLRMIRDIDRKAFAVHLDFANMISSIERYHHRKAFIEECFAKLGPFIKSIHAKDVLLENRMPCVLTEQMPGKGGIDFAHVLRLAAELDADVPLYTEHLNSREEYGQSMRFLNMVAEQQGIPVRKIKAG